MDTKQLLTTKAERDVVRDRLVRALAAYELPDELKTLLEADQQATAAFESVWMNYQVAKAQQEAA